MKNILHKVRGFTLIELLVVIAIIGLLTGIVVANLTSSRARARDAKRVSDLGQIQLSLELFFDRCNSYPHDLVTTDNAGGDCPTGITLGTFMTNLPRQPISDADYDYVADDSDGYNSYVLHSTLESTNENLKDSITLDRLPDFAQGTSCYDPSDTDSKEYCISSPFLPEACDPSSGHCWTAP